MSERSTRSPLISRATYSDSAELIEPLIEFVLVMLGLGEKFKAGTKLATAIAKRIAAAYDEHPVDLFAEPPLSDSKVETREIITPKQLNLREILDRLSISNIELEPGMLGKLLREYTVVGHSQGVCASSTDYAASPSRWISEDGWVRTTLQDSSLRVTEEDTDPTLRLSLPHSRMESGGPVGMLIEVRASKLQEPAKYTARHYLLRGDHALALQISFLSDSEQQLRECGLYAQSARPYPGFSIALAEARSGRPIFRLTLLITGSKEV